MSCHHREVRSHTTAPTPPLHHRRLCACRRLNLDQLTSAHDKVPDTYDDEVVLGDDDDVEAATAAATERLQACKKFVAVGATPSSRRCAHAAQAL